MANLQQPFLSTNSKTAFSATMKLRCVRFHDSIYCFCPAYIITSGYELLDDLPGFVLLARGVEAGLVLMGQRGVRGLDSDLDLVV